MTLKDKLEKACLPKKYPRMTDSEKRAARMRTLQGWYEKDRPDQLCNDVDALIAAHYLWAEFYFKADPFNRGVYYYDDPLCKYDMIRMAMSSPIHKTEPAKSVVHAPRRLGKTQTLIQELCSLLAITRPYTQVLVSQANTDRTREEIKKLRNQIENNKRIQMDFGGETELYPRRHSSAASWRDNCLDFIHHPGSSIIGHSINSAQRGRGPIFGVVDDPENDEDSYNQKWRKDFFQKLFGVYLNMFHSGGKILWIGTVIHGSSCLAQALQGLSQKEEELEAPDTRFDDWHKRRFKMIDEDEDGNLFSQQPQRLTVDAFEIRKRAHGPATVMAELQGMPITPGQTAFNYDPYKHGYMRCKDATGEYFFDLLTGEKKPWKEFLSGLVVYGAGDLADGVSPDCDPGAVVFVGIDACGIRYVLDVFNKRLHAEYLIEHAYTLAQAWHCEALAWEKTGMQTVVVRLAKRHMESLRDQGHRVPRLVEIANYKRDKVSRILTLIPYFNQDRIRFLHFTPVTDSEGVTHEPTVVPNKRYHHNLLDQVIEFTDEGLRGPDDAADALEMAMRISADARGITETGPKHLTDQLMDNWADAGFELDKRCVPVNLWSPRMLEDNMAHAFEDDFWETVHG